MYILDTNTLIYYFKGVGEVGPRLLRTPPRDIGIPSIVVYELEVGIGKSTFPEKRSAQLDTMLSFASILPFGHPEAKVAAEIRLALEIQGQTIGPYDILIAATAVANQAVLVTHNTREFGRIEQLLIEDWY